MSELFFQSNLEKFQLLPCHLSLLSNKALPEHCQILMHRRESTCTCESPQRNPLSTFPTTEACKCNCCFHLRAFRKSGQEGVQMDDFWFNHCLKFLKRCRRESQRAEKWTRSHSVCVRMWSVCVSVFSARVRCRFSEHFNLLFQFKQFTFIFLHLEEWPCCVPLGLNEEMCVFFLASAFCVLCEAE